STTAFAVSIDTRLSSSRIVSPTLTCHSTMVASGRPSPRSGRWKALVAIEGVFGIGISIDGWWLVVGGWWLVKRWWPLHQLPTINHQLALGSAARRQRPLRRIH